MNYNTQKHLPLYKIITMRVSFDFDGTLTNKDVKEYAKTFSEAYIVSQRPPNFFKDVFDVAQEIGVPMDRIVFCGVQPKEDFLRDISPVFHLDDKEVNFKNLVLYKEGWKLKCEQYVEAFK